MIGLILNFLSAIAFNVEEAEILLSSKGLISLTVAQSVKNNLS